MKPMRRNSKKVNVFVSVGFDSEISYMTIAYIKLHMIFSKGMGMEGPHENVRFNEKCTG